MFIVTWTYEVMEGKSRQDLLAVVEATAKRCERAPGLLRRYAALGSGLKSVIEFYVWRSKADADAYYDLEWDGETSRAWEAARMTRRDYEVVSVVEAAGVREEA
jgi:chloramphenicol 3-O-phosphotransferase